MADDTYAPLVADRAPLNSVKWAARDYPSLFDDLLRRLKLLYQEVYNDYATTTQGIMLIEMMAYATAQIQWYMDRIASDCFLETSRTHTAVGRIVKQLGYKLRPASAASTELTLTFTDGTTGPFVMPARWRFQGPNGLVYESYAQLAEPAALAPGETRTIMVRQGDSRILTFTGNGQANQVYNLSGIPDGRYLADLSVECWVDGMEWEERTFLTYAADEQFEVSYLDAPPKVRFGDGIAGAIPPVGAEVKFRFVIIDGVKGNEPKAHAINASIDTLVVGGVAVKMVVDNLVAPNGGSNPETVEHAKKLAPLSFAARGAAITEPDYNALSNSFVDPLYGAVAKAYAFNPRGTYSDIQFDLMFVQVTGDLIVYVGVASTMEANIQSSVAAIGPLLADLDAALVQLEAKRVDQEGQAGTAKSLLAGAQASCSTAETALDTIKTTADDQKLALQNLIDYVLTNLSAGATRDYIEAELTSAKSQAQTMSVKATQATSDVQTANNAMGNAISNAINPLLDGITNPAPVFPDTSLPQIEADLTAASGGIAAILPVLEAEANALVGTAQALKDDIDPVLNSMQVRIGELFSDDCLSNYVQVPILAKDADGNFAAPSVGLINGLQAYLDGIKEVTQQVEVIDGAPILVPAQIKIQAVIGPAYIYAEEIAKVRSAVIELLKDRDFNSPLYLSQLYDTVKKASIGFTYVNITIQGPVLYLDAGGNLVPPENRIITLAVGGLTIEQIYV
jgi:hypothetical protein